MYNDMKNNRQNELYHYGVIGMKWGMRKARKQGTNYTYKSHGQKKWEKKLQKMQTIDKPVNRKTADKIKQAQRKLDTFKKRDKNRQTYAESTTVGKSVAKGLLMGPFGAGNYNRLRAAGHTRAASFMKSNLIASTLALPLQVVASRDDEFVSTK